MPWWWKLAIAGAVPLPSLLFRYGGVDLPHLLALLVFGSAVVAAAFLLAWGAEAAEVDISSSLAVALLALIAILPEFAVDLYFAYTAGSNPAYAAYAAANMTGSNRLLIGFGWSLVALVFITAGWRRARNRGNRGNGGDGAAPGGAGPGGLLRRGGVSVLLRPEHRIELGFLGLASVYAVVIPLTSSIAWYDSIVLIGLFIVYLWRTARVEQEEPDLIGMAATIAGQPRRRRRIMIVLLFVFAAAMVLSAAEPFAEALIGTGEALGIDEFLLVQWLAPLASEAPELLIASMFAFRGKGDKGVGTLLSAEVNQWTLLVGMLPLAYVAGGGDLSLPLDPRQNAEFVLTSAQAVLGFAVLMNLRFHRWEALAMMALFLVQFAFPDPDARRMLAALYVLIAVVILVRHWRQFRPIGRTVTRRGAEHEEVPAGIAGK